jgi:hypothetical protein
MTLDDLAAFGFDRATLSERLKIAQLPAPLLARVLAGSVSRETARKLVRLTQAQQERIASMAEVGEEITIEKVNTLLRAQINAGLAPIQSTLARGWEDQAATDLSPDADLSPQEVDTTPGDDEQAGQATCPSASNTSMSALLSALRVFTCSPGSRTAPKAVQTLAQALEQQLRLSLREAHATPQFESTVHPQS